MTNAWKNAKWEYLSYAINPLSSVARLPIETIYPPERQAKSINATQVTGPSFLLPQRLPLTREMMFLLFFLAILLLARLRLDFVAKEEFARR